MTQKTIAQFLDQAASRSKNPASGKQCWFLAGLILKAGETINDVFDITNTNVALSMKEASALISDYLAGN